MVLPFRQDTTTADRVKWSGPSGSGSRHHAVVDAVRAIGRLEPRIAAQVVALVVDVGIDAAGRQRGNDLVHSVVGWHRASAGGAGSVARIVSVRCGGGVSRGRSHTGGHPRIVGVRRGGGSGSGARGVARRVGAGSGGAALGGSYGRAYRGAGETGRERPAAAVIAP